MKVIFALIAFLISSVVLAQNPFEKYLTAPVADEEFWPHTPSFKVPFVVSDKVENKALDLNRIIQDHPKDALKAMASLYKDFEFVPGPFMYAYPFPIHPRWGILTHPYVESVPSSKEWIEHFKFEPKLDEGVRGYKFQQELDELTGTKAYAGNTLTHLKSPHSYAAILDQLAKANHHVFMSNYLFQYDKGTEPLLDLIEQKTMEGVRVFILYDRLYANGDPKCAKKLRAAGAEVVLFRYKNITHFIHEKMFVFDGKYAQIDGQNIIAAQTLSKGTNNLLNDVGIGIKGPLVTVIANRFIHFWQTLMHKQLPKDIVELYKEQTKDIEKYASNESVQAAVHSGKGLCRLVAKEPTKELSNIMKMFLHTVKRTQHYFFFNFLDAQYKNTINNQPGEIFLNAVAEKVNNDPDFRVDMLTNNWRTATGTVFPDGYMPNENFFTWLTLNVVDAMMKKPETQMHKIRSNIMGKMNGDNFHLWSYAQYMHAKTMMSDNVWSIVGTHNLNGISETIGYESAVACLDTKLAAQMQKSIVVDALNSIPVPLK